MSKKKSKFRCEYEKGYDFEGVEFYDGDDQITSLWVDTREKSEKIIKFVNEIVSHIERRRHDKKSHSRD